MPRSAVRLPLFVAGLGFACLWGMGPVAVKWGLDGSGPLTLVTVRMVIAGAVLLLLAMGARQRIRPQGRQWVQLAVLGLLSSTIYFGFFAWAVTLLPAAMVSLFVTLQPMVAALTNSLWLGTRIRAIQWVGMGVSLLGLATVFVPRVQGGEVSLLGLGLLFVALLGFVLGTNWYVKSHLATALPPLSVNGWQNAFGALLLLPFALGLEDLALRPSPLFFLGLGWLSLLNSVGAILLLFWMMRKHPFAASMWQVPPPMVGVLAAWLFLDEALTPTMGLGALIVVAGMALMQVPRRQAVAAPTI